MSEQYGIVVDLDRCVGCYACEVACKMEHDSAPNTPGIKLHTLGPYTLDGRLRMDYVPMLSDSCSVCQPRLVTKQQPMCIAACPTKALQLCEARMMLDILQCQGRRHVCGIREVSL